MCLPTLSASAATKRYLTETERGKKKEKWQDAEQHNSPGAIHPLYLSSACTHAGVFDLTIFSCAPAWNSFKFTKPLLFGGADDRECTAQFLWMIRAAVTRKPARRWYLKAATCAASLKNTTSSRSTLPVTSFNASYSRKPWLRGSDYFDESEADCRARDKGGGWGAACAAAGIF